jgi:hypothetical protein
MLPSRASEDQSRAFKPRLLKDMYSLQQAFHRLVEKPISKEITAPLSAAVPYCLAAIKEADCIK